MMMTLKECEDNCKEYNQEIDYWEVLNSILVNKGLIEGFN